MSDLRLVIAQIRPRKADYAENLRRVGSVFAQVATLDEPPGLIVLPETAMSGYFLEGGVQEVAVTAGTLFRDLAQQHSLSGAPPLDVAVGFYEEFRSRYHNSALYASLGGVEPGIRHVHRKIFLPTYGVFDEERFVDRGHSVQAFDTGWGRAAMMVCEDSWHSLVATLAALDGARLVIIPSASPARGVGPDRSSDGEALPQSVRRWERVVRHIAEEHGMYVVLAQLSGFEGGKGLQGGSVVVGPRGDVLVRGPVFEEAIVTATLKTDELKRARAESPLLADLEAELLNLLSGDVHARSRPVFDPEDPCPRSPKPAAAAGHGVVVPRERGDPLVIDAQLTERWLATFLRDEIVERRGFERGLVGLSGGVDSAVTAALAARALGVRNVMGVAMPYRTSSSESREHAAAVAGQLGIELVTVDISDAVDALMEKLEEGADPARRGNVMARMRMITLFDLSMKHAALPLGTSNKSERLLGYFTWHGDDAPPVNPLGDLFKTQVLQLARHLGIPDEIIAKPPTADLVQDQTDEADLGIGYDRADPILHWLLDGRTLEEIVALGFTKDEVQRVHRRLQSTHWKRRLPTVAMLTATAIGESYLRPVDY
jgi:NAD+ synthetase